MTGPPTDDVLFAACQAKGCERGTLGVRQVDVAEVATAFGVSIERVEQALSSNGYSKAGDSCQ